MITEITKNIEEIKIFLENQIIFKKRDNAFKIALIFSAVISFLFSSIYTLSLGEEMMLMGTFIMVLLMTLGVVAHRSGKFNFYNKKEHEKLKERDLLGLIDKTQFYTKKELNKKISIFDSFSKIEKKYIIHYLKDTEEGYQDIYQDLIIGNFLDLITKKGNDKFITLNSYVQGIKVQFSKNKEINIHYVSTVLINNYLLYENKIDFFENKNKLISLIKKEITIKEQNSFANKIEEKINNYNEESNLQKDINSRFEKLKETQIKNNKTDVNKSILIKNI
jgi:hypothetical protein